MMLLNLGTMSRLKLNLEGGERNGNEDDVPVIRWPAAALRWSVKRARAREDVSAGV